MYDITELHNIKGSTAVKIMYNSMKPEPSLTFCARIAHCYDSVESRTCDMAIEGEEGQV